MSPTCFSLPSNEMNTLWFGTEEGNIYEANRFDRAGLKSGLNQNVVYKGHSGPVLGIDFHPMSGPVDFSDLFLTCGVVRYSNLWFSDIRLWYWLGLRWFISIYFSGGGGNTHTKRIGRSSCGVQKATMPRWNLANLQMYPYPPVARLHDIRPVRVYPNRPRDQVRIWRHQWHQFIHLKRRTIIFLMFDGILLIRLFLELWTDRVNSTYGI